MLESPLILGVNKYHRFLAAKLLSETLMTSGLELDNPDYPTDSDPTRDLLGTAKQLHKGLRSALERDYGFCIRQGRPQQLPVDKL